MRYGASFKWKSWDEEDRKAHVNIRCDGGFKDGTGAAGWVIVAGRGPARRVVACGCLHLKSLKHATEAEAIALEQAFNHFKEVEQDLIPRVVVASPAGIVGLIGASTR